MLSSTVRDIMKKNVVSVYPETSLLEAHRVLQEHRFDGVPVVDGEKHLVGILTEYDLIAKGSSLHLPTFQKILAELDVLRRDRTTFQDEVAQLKKITVADVMNADPLTFLQDTTLSEAIAVFRDHHRVNPVPVITKDRIVIGVVSRYDVLKLLDMLK